MADFRRVLRSVLWLIVGLLLGGWAVLANASFAPQWSGQIGAYTCASVDHIFYIQPSDPAAFCSTATQFLHTNCSNFNHVLTPSPYGIPACAYEDGFSDQSVSVTSSSCPSNSTLKGSSCTCNAGYDEVSGQCLPQCPSGQTRNSSGQCATPCQSGAAGNFSAFAGWSIASGNSLNSVVGADGGAYVAPPTVCNGSCVIRISGVTSGSCSAPPGGAIDNPQPVTCQFQGVLTGDACSTSTIPSAGTPPSIPQKKPPCDASQGVLTSSTGKVVCISSAIPSVRPPQVSTTTSTKTFPDNSSSTTTKTTTTDPGTGARDTTETTDCVPGPTGTTQCGPPGTTVKSTSTGPDPSKTDQADTFTSPGTSGLYTKKDATVAGAIAKFQAAVGSAPVVAGASGFFNLGNISGACPNVSASVPYLNVTIDMTSIFCGSTALSIMDIAGPLVMLGAAFLAFIWAFL